MRSRQSHRPIQKSKRYEARNKEKSKGGYFTFTTCLALGVSILAISCIFIFNDQSFTDHDIAGIDVDGSGMNYVDDATEPAAAEQLLEQEQISSVVVPSVVSSIINEVVVTVPLVVLDTRNVGGSSATSSAGSNSNSFPVQRQGNVGPATAVRHLHMDDYKTQKRQSSTHPLLLSGAYETKVQSDFAKRTEYASFVSEFGNYTQYIKDQSMQPLKDKHRNKCVAPMSSMIPMMKASKKGDGVGTKNLSFVTYDSESPAFFHALRQLYTTPEPLDFAKDTTDTDGMDGSFHVFSAMVQGSFQAFTNSHGGAHMYQIHGRKMWWFASPEVPQPTNANPCHFLSGQGDVDATNAALENANVLSVLQQPGDTIFVPKGWWHATCALDDWTVAVGMQRGSRDQFRQKFSPLPQPFVQGGGKASVTATRGDTRALDPKAYPMPWVDAVAFQSKMTECGVKFDWNNLDSWTWFHGDLNKYYNVLIGSDSKRNPKDIKSYAVHRWLSDGKRRSTLVHYELIYSMIRQFTATGNSADGQADDAQGLRLLDAGCGLGAGLMWFETNGPTSWELVGHTISTSQLDFIHKLPSRQFQAVLKSYDDLNVYKDENKPLDVIYSIEAFVHSPDERNTLKNWSGALADQGIVVLIDDFLTVGTDKDADDVQLYSKSWMGTVLQTTSSLAEIAEKYHLHLVVDRDLGSEYQINKRNYRNKLPDIAPTKKKSHQGWLGSGMRQQLMVQGKLTYRLLVFKKEGGLKSISQLSNFSKGRDSDKSQCTAVQSRTEDTPLLEFDPIEADHKSGRGNGGGKKQKCISGWYCCGMGEEWWDNLESKRTDSTGYLKLSKSLFGNYMDKIVEHLNKFYGQLPVGTKGKFLDIGGTGSVSSGMSKVTSKFAHFAGPFDYWVLDSDPAAKEVENALYCDMSDCPEADDCGFDVTFSHTVLEHTPRPWDAFDTIARVTKKGGLTMHVVPFSYQYHATPDDNYRFSHKALTSLLEDRGFKILDVGYDICTKPDEILKTKVDEHFDVIWLAYVIAQKI